MSHFLKAAAIFSLALAAGCQSWSVVQTNVFVDDNGYIVRVDYGRSESQHVNTFIAPTNGKEMEFKSRLVVRAHLPDGSAFTAWQCMNFLPSGTMYKTDNDEWMLHANGFSTVVYRQTKENKTRYREVFRGVLCDTPGEFPEKKESKWRSLPPQTRNERMTNTIE